MSKIQGSLILDTGTYMCKSGYSSDEVPRFNYPLIYGFPKECSENNVELNYVTSILRLPAFPELLKDYLARPSNDHYRDYLRYQ